MEDREGDGVKSDVSAKTSELRATAAAKRNELRETAVA
jgi:hypothetical protein